MLFKQLLQITLKYLSYLFLIVIILMQASFTASANIIITLEEPAAASVNTGIANLRGWAIGLAEIERIELFIDNQYISDIPSGADRNDVAMQYSSYPNANKSGFSLAFPFTLLSSGEHTILVRAYDVNGLTQNTSTTFTVAKLNNEFIDNPDLVSLSNASISIVGQEIVVTDLLADNNTYDIRLRWRVATQQFEMVSVIQKSAANLQSQLNLSGSQNKNLASVTPIIVTLEEPSAVFPSNGIANLRGWAIGLAKIEKIELYIDGVYSTNIPSGATRNDVKNNYPNYPNSDESGFSMAFPYYELAEGNHTILVKAYDENGLTQEMSTTFNVVKMGDIFIDDLSNVSLDDASVSIQNEQIIISNFKANNAAHTLHLEWYTPSQQFEINSITAIPKVDAACSDGLDNDRDNLIDFPNDPGCDNADDMDEADPESLTSEDAARFLTQSTFGPTLEDINALTTLGSYESWIEQQFTLPISTIHKTALTDLWFKSCPGNQQFSEEFFSNVFWHAIIDESDQLRQRLAFALSEIFVVSGVGPLNHSALGLADYYDVLNKHAFGNYRDLLEEITLHPAMGIYLSMLRNEKANPELNIRPDENYAREVLQLFSIGVHELNIDGAIKRANGNPVETYSQDVIEGFAKVFTGWNFANLDRWDAYIGNGDLTQPMVAWPEYHDSENDKLLLNNVVLAAGGTAEEDLDAALDNIFNHPNVAPFISKQLIQRLITSNPTPTYIARVAQVFNNNGNSVRGDLKAVVKAILLDNEARTEHPTSSNFGKLREPILQLSHMRRALNAIPVTLEGPRYGGADCGRGSYQLYLSPFGQPRTVFGQDFLLAPSVFNFFLPDYSPPGILRDAGLVAPEFQIRTENTIVGLTNVIGFEIQRSGTDGIRWATLDLSYETSLANNPDQLLNHLNLILLNGRMSTALRQILQNHLTNDVFSDDESGRAEKTKDIIMLILTSPDYLIQK